MMRLYYSEGAGTTRFRAAEGTLSQLRVFVAQFNNSRSTWEIEDESGNVVDTNAGEVSE